jgi:hypothetical protein
MQRDAIPTDIKRAVLVEAGHRCAIPTCRATTTEIAHIVPWAESQDSSFENLIALSGGSGSSDRNLSGVSGKIC